jgi:hypothetical protein
MYSLQETSHTSKGATRPSAGDEGVDMAICLTPDLGAGTGKVSFKVSSILSKISVHMGLLAGTTSDRPQTDPQRSPLAPTGRLSSPWRYQPYHRRLDLHLL